MVLRQATLFSFIINAIKKNKPGYWALGRGDEEGKEEEDFLERQLRISKPSATEQDGTSVLRLAHIMYIVHCTWMERMPPWTPWQQQSKINKNDVPVDHHKQCRCRTSDWMPDSSTVGVSDNDVE